ncbi:hypothetical protein F2P56_010114 [Juglans regia]|uniref:Serine/arginine-rich splicing factor 4-like n=2 Tax=Juglans regia TaxID=51240 RepID=A0A833XYU5_JUGRE|nr:serine-arginine protein 55-like [Juglans regia]KAF5473509.1 hypothetical protein F2P56_010114 [Juglans regia]
MSLYIGNLSAETRRDELENVFRRFGRCSVQLKKDGYGFVVFDFRLDAEKALRALQGRNICGEPLTLTWSNKQPRPFQRFGRGARSHESQHRRNAARGDYASVESGPNVWREKKLGIGQQVTDGGRHNSADMLDDETGYHQDNTKNIEEECKSLHDEGGSVIANQVDNDRWDGQAFDPSNDDGVENGIGLDRYEPYYGYDRKGKSENPKIEYAGGSPVLRSSRDNLEKEQIGAAALNYTNDSKPRQTCYNCGGFGHKMHNCPKERASGRKSTRLDCRQDDDVNKSGRGKVELDRFGSKSRGKLHSSRDNMSARQPTNSRRASGSRYYWKLIKSGSSPVTEESDREHRRGRGGKKRRREIGSPAESNPKNAQRSILSSHHSEYTTSRSHSTFQPSNSVPKSIRCRSASPRENSLSSNSKSSSRSHNYGSRSSNSRSSSSSPTSLALSPSSPNKMMLNLKGSICNSTPESMDISVKQGKPIDSIARLENSKLDKKMMMVDNENVPSSSKVEHDLEKDHPLERDDNGNHIVSGSSYEATNPSALLSDKGALTAGCSATESLGEMVEFQNSGASEMEHMLALIEKSDSKTFANSQKGCSISSEEMYMVLKHYGLEVPEENERHPSIEAYFGSARLWPWGIIYYRSMKKGPISVENYARRVAQNKEFGIVDKYIRSSSGWGEMDKDNS